jgi:hypothetical protein
MIRRFFFLFSLSFLVAGALSPTIAQAFETTNNPITTPTHKQFKVFRPTHESFQVNLETFCLDSKGNIVAAVSTHGAQSNNKPINGMVLIYSPEFELVKQVDLDFAPTALNFDSDGTLYVAGNGAVAKYTADGTLVKRNSTPNLLNKDDLRQKAIEKLKAEREQMGASYKSQIQMIDKAMEIKKKGDQKDDGSPKKDAKDEKDPSTDEEATEEATEELDEDYIAQLAQVSLEELENMRKSYNEYLKQFRIGEEILDSEIESAISGMGQVRSLAVGEEDIFVTCPANLGYGYDIWRVNKELEEPKVVVKGVSGCCGQMDIQAKGKQLLIAENTKFRVGVYNQQGKLTSKFGSQDRTGKTGFGSCCNPMNIRCCENGDVLTAESSIGTIKRFDAAGNLVAVVGKAKIGGGCKHVALGHDTKLDRYYMMYQDEAAICVLVNQKEFPGETEDELMARQATEGLGKKVLGSWELVGTKPEDKSNEKDEASGDGAVSVGGESLSIADLYGFKKITFKPESGVDVVSAGKYQMFGQGSEWLPVRQEDKRLTISMLNDQVENMKLMVEFTSDDEAKFGLEFGRGSPTQWLGTFKRVSQ